jgi:hypothetical protein
VFHDLNPENILVRQRDVSAKRLVVIDGIGHKHCLPVAGYSPGFALKKLSAPGTGVLPADPRLGPRKRASVRPHLSGAGATRIHARANFCLSQ